MAIATMSSRTDRPRIQRSKQTLASEIYRVLKDDILTCQLLPGQMINESELVESFQVSKTPIREALKMLIQEGLVESIPSIGYKVASIEIDDLKEQYDMQNILEAAAVERAIPRVTEEGLARLESLVGESFVLSDKESVIRWFKSNNEFHIAIAELSGNRRLVSLLRSVLEEMIRPSFLSEFSSNMSTEVFIAHHREIVDAIRQKDVQLATQLLHKQNKVGFASVLERLTKEGLEL
ncbi:MAG: GntR family transcriptional regulator [Anaerolineales bacterium]|nr:GntR family transcriptional regulator [Anaerolineales bacterium]